MTEPEPCTTSGVTCHQSVNLALVTDSIYITGRAGTSLCGYRAYDERAATENLGQPIILADLPSCRRCEVAANARSRGPVVRRPRLGRPTSGPAPRIDCPHCGKNCAMRKDGSPQRHVKQLASGRQSMLICQGARP